MANKDFHFEIGHFCAGCLFSNTYHAGCVTEGSVEVWKTSQKQTPVTPDEQAELFAVAYEPSQTLFQE